MGRRLDAIDAHRSEAAGCGAAGLRALQGRRQLEQLVAAVKAQRDRMPWPTGPPPLLVKIAPDLTPDEMKVPAPAAAGWCTLAPNNMLSMATVMLSASYVCALQDIAALTLQLGVDGLVVGNTTLSRPGAVAQHQHGSEVAASHCNCRRSTAYPLTNRSPMPAATGLQHGIGCVIHDGACAKLLRFATTGRRSKRQTAAGAGNRCTTADVPADRGQGAHHRLRRRQQRRGRVPEDQSRCRPLLLPFWTLHRCTQYVWQSEPCDSADQCRHWLQYRSSIRFCPMLQVPHWWNSTPRWCTRVPRSYRG